MQHSVSCDLPKGLPDFDLVGLRRNFIKKDICTHWGHFIQAVSGDDGQLAYYYAKHGCFSNIPPSDAVTACDIVTKYRYKKITEHESIRPVITIIKRAASSCQANAERSGELCAKPVVVDVGKFIDKATEHRHS